MADKQDNAENDAARWARHCLDQAAKHLARHVEFPYPETAVHMTCAALFMSEAMKAIDPHVFQSEPKEPTK